MPDIRSSGFADHRHIFPGGLDALTILENTADSVVVVDEEWRCIYFNRRAAETLGLAHRQIGGNLWEMFPKLAESETGAAFKRAMAERVATESEDRLPLSGEWYASNTCPIDNGLAIFFRKISGRKEAEDAITASEHRFRAMFDTLTQGVVFQDTRGTIVEANQAAERILGLGRADLIGRTGSDPIWQHQDEDGNPITDENFPGMLALQTGETSSNLVIGIYNPILEERRWLRLDVIPLFDSFDSSPKQVCVIFDDVTEQRCAEMALRESQAHLALAQRVASVGSATFDFRTGAWKWSDETYRIYGVKREEYVPVVQDMGRFIHPEDLESYLEGIQTAHRGVVPYPLEYRVVRPDGTIRVVYREADLLYDNSGAVTGVISTKRDITDLRAAERQKDALQKQLYHAQRLDALGTLAGGIAHDLNNTLVPIIGLSEAMLASLPAEDGKRPLLDLIYKAGTRARDLVGQILSFSRRENSNKCALNLLPFMEDTMRLARATVPRTIIIKDKFADVPPIFGDASQLHQVVLNLIANAAHAIGDRVGAIKIEVAEWASAPGDSDQVEGFVRISVSDNGCGMDEETQKRIFEPFFTTKNVGVGTGLGLSVVHGIVTAHGGRIQVSSKIGRGSRFDVYLPTLSEAQQRFDERMTA